MKALTVQQPWASAIIELGKDIENRTQLWQYRGPLAIHAGARWSDRGEQSPILRQAQRHHFPPRRGVIEGGKLPRARFPLGAIIGVVDLVDVHPDAGCCQPWGETAYVEHGGRERRRITHLVLENPRPLVEPIPYKGALGLWTVPTDLLGDLP